MSGIKNLGMLFPGQGSQSVGMGRELNDEYPAVRKLFDRAGEVLGFDLASLCFEGPDEQLARTMVTQPAIFVHSVAVYELLADRGFVPGMTAGHSLGEYSALVAAGFLGFEEALSLVKLRGELMQTAGEQAPGAMAAVIGMGDEEVGELCGRAEGLVVPANYNAPGQVVVSGSTEGVDWVAANAREAGARMVKKLNVSGAFHSPLMEYAVAPMRDRLEKAVFTPGKVPVVPNVTGEPETDPENIRKLLVRQITSPVRWTLTVRNMAAAGLESYVEAGPGSVLSGLAKRIDRSLKIASVGAPADLEQL